MTSPIFAVEAAATAASADCFLRVFICFGDNPWIAFIDFIVLYFSNVSENLWTGKVAKLITSYLTIMMRSKKTINSVVVFTPKNLCNALGLLVVVWVTCSLPVSNNCFVTAPSPFW